MPRKKKVPPAAAKRSNVERGAETRGALLEGALDVFAELDYEAASVRDLTAAWCRSATRGW
jgi:AcrR family transcriptional regulator